jgi:type II secretory pathway component PulK
MTVEMPERRGFALLAVLWVIVGVSAIAAASLLVAREGVSAARNRMALTRARWQADDCIERARAVIDDALADRGDVPRPVPGGWAVLDRVVTASPAVTAASCDLTLQAAGTAVNVNTADADQLTALLTALGIDAVHTDSMVDALLDWRDADDVPRQFGAERAWYRAARLPAPRNGPLANIGEVRLVRGFGPDVFSDSVLDSVLTVEPGRIVWDRAPMVVLASLPGMTPEALGVIADLRLRGLSVGDVSTLGASLSPGAAQTLSARYADLQRLTTSEPDAWLLIARGHDGHAPVVTATIEDRIVRAGTRAAVVRRWTTP